MILHNAPFQYMEFTGPHSITDAILSTSQNGLTSGYDMSDVLMGIPLRVRSSFRKIARTPWWHAPSACHEKFVWSVGEQVQAGPGFCSTGPHGATLNTLRPRQNGRHFPDDIFKWIFLNENVWISINISLKFVPGGPINNIPTLVQIMAWRRSGDKPLSEPMMVSLPTHICATRPQCL